jgi:hypothetical protein
MPFFHNSGYMICKFGCWYILAQREFDHRIFIAPPSDIDVTHISLSDQENPQNYNQNCSCQIQRTKVMTRSMSSAPHPCRHHIGGQCSKTLMIHFLQPELRRPPGQGCHSFDWQLSAFTPLRRRNNPPVMDKTQLRHPIACLRLKEWNGSRCRAGTQICCWSWPPHFVWVSSVKCWSAVRWCNRPFRSRLWTDSHIEY